MSQSNLLFAGLVAVPNRMCGGFNFYLTGGIRDPQKWMRGTLSSGQHYFEGDKAALEVEAAKFNRKLVKTKDYYQLVAQG